MKAIDHNGLARASWTWLSNRVSGRGIRGDREVSVGEKYVADFFALCSFQHTYFDQYCKHWGTPLITRPRYPNMPEMAAYTIDSYDLPDYFACLFEAKATRSDFLSTFGENRKNHRNRHEPVANLHWCVTPRKLIDADELPDFWGLLEWTGRGLREVKMPTLCQQSDATIDKLAHGLIWQIETWNKYWSLHDAHGILQIKVGELEREIGRLKC
jgi:hypothetical protein